MMLTFTTADHSSITRKTKLNFLRYPSAHIHHRLCLTMTLFSVGQAVVETPPSASIDIKTRVLSGFPDIHLAIASLVLLEYTSSWSSIICKIEAHVCCPKAQCEPCLQTSVRNFGITKIFNHWGTLSQQQLNTFLYHQKAPDYYESRHHLINLIILHQFFNAIQ